MKKKTTKKSAFVWTEQEIIAKLRNRKFIVHAIISLNERHVMGEPTWSTRDLSLMPSFALQIEQSRNDDGWQLNERQLSEAAGRLRSYSRTLVEIANRGGG